MRYTYEYELPRRDYKDTRFGSFFSFTLFFYNPHLTRFIYKPRLTQFFYKPR